MVDGALGKHGHVLDLRLSQVRAVGRNEDHLGLSFAKCLQRVLVSQNRLSGLHDQLETTVHGVLLLLLLLGNHLDSRNESTLLGLNKY